MRTFTKFLAASAAAASALTLAASAQAATFTTVTGPAPDGSLAWDFGNTGGITTGAFTDDFTFSVAIPGTESGSIQASFTSAANNLKFTSATLDGNLFTLFNVGNTHYAQIDLLSIGSGPHTIEVKGISPGIAGSYTGHLTFSPNAVPEPATWGLMLVGFGGMGAMLRSNRRRTVAATA